MAKKITIGIDIRTLMDRNYSGVSNYTLNLIQALLQLDQKNHYKLFYNSFSDITSQIPSFKAPNVSLVRSRYPNKLLNYTLFKGLDWPKIDSVLGCDIFLMPHINFISLKNYNKSIITIHDLSFLRNPEFFSVRKNFWHKLIGVKALANKFNKIIAISENTKNDIVELLNVDEKKISVIHSGLNYNTYPELIEEEIIKDLNLPKKYLLFIATLEPRKNIEAIIASYNELRKKKNQFKDIKLVLAGLRGWKCEDIFKIIHASPFKTDIIITGYINNNEKSVIYKNASIFLFPSLYEGFGFPPLEAMFFGIPVISSTASCLPEILGSSALLVNPLNTTELTAAIELVLDNDDQKKQLIDSGSRNILDYSWVSTAKQYLAVFDSITKI